MKLLKALNGQIVKYPYTRFDLETEFPNDIFPISLEGVDLSAYGVFHISPSSTAPMPSSVSGTISMASGNAVVTPNPNYVPLVEGIPALVNGRWEQTFN